MDKNVIKEPRKKCCINPIRIDILFFRKNQKTFLHTYFYIHKYIGRVNAIFYNINQALLIG